MLDWGQVTYATGASNNSTHRRKGLDALSALPPQYLPMFSMARILGDPQQYRMRTGRRVLVAWVGNSTFAAQSLARDLSLSPSGKLLQRFVPELRMLRLPPADAPFVGLQAEVYAQFVHIAADDNAEGTAGVSVLASLDNPIEKTRVGVDWSTETVFVDGTRQGNPAVRAGPLLGSKTNVSVHVYVDHAYVTAIFNEQVALTVLVTPTSAAQGVVESFTSCFAAPCDSMSVVMAWPLRSANNVDVRPL